MIRSVIFGGLIGCGSKQNFNSPIRRKWYSTRTVEACARSQTVKSPPMVPIQLRRTQWIAVKMTQIARRHSQTPPNAGDAQ